MDGATVVVKAIRSGEVAPVQGELLLPFLDCGCPGFVAGEFDVGAVQDAVLIFDQEGTNLGRRLNGEVRDARCGVYGKVGVAIKGFGVEVHVRFHASEMSADYAEMWIVGQETIA